MPNEITLNWEAVARAFAAENAELLRDKERLDWLQMEAEVVVLGSPLVGDLRDAIDGARRETQP